MEFRVISIGAMAANELWGEREITRTGHATTTLIESTSSTEGPGSGSPVRLLVDPGLPESAIAARLAERTGLEPGDVTHVFLTSFRPEVRRGIGAFDQAQWLISSAEREGVGVPLAQGLQRLAQNFEEPDAETQRVLQADIALLQKCTPAPDRIADGVDLFPLPGVTPGLTGLLLTGAQTTLVCGDAIPTEKHLRDGRVPGRAENYDQAMESFREAVEIADLLILGRDNLVVNPTKRPF